MNGYFLKRRDPTLPLSFIPMGMKMMSKGKLHLPSGELRGVLGPMFTKAREMGDGS